MTQRILILFLLLSSSAVLGKTQKISLEEMYKQNNPSKKFIENLKKKTLEQKQDAVPVLIKVMKKSDFPDGNRWVATYMLGKIMGQKSAPFISKFAQHPNWMLRLASMKVLLHLGQKKYIKLYKDGLTDKSLIVRHQALQNIRELQLTELAPDVWNMLFNKENYYGAKGKRVRGHIIKEVIKVIGDLGFEKAKKPMLKMIQNKKYKDIHPELDYSLTKITKKKSPKGALTIKKHFWKRVAISNKTI